MRILMLTPYLPYPPSSGGQVRSFNLLKHLSKKHQITLCSLIKYESDKKYIPSLENFCQKIYVFKRSQTPWTFKNILQTAFSSFPFLVIRNFSEEEKKFITKLLKEETFDLIHAETFYVSPHIPNTTVPIVLVDQTIEYQVYQHYVKNFPISLLRPLLYIDVQKIKYWEQFYWRKAKRVVSVSEKDASEMRRLVPHLPVTVVPNGVGEDFTKDVKIHSNNTILLMGNYAWLQNIESANILATKVYPLIKKTLPEVKVKIAGQNTSRIQNLKGDGIELNEFAVDDSKSVQDAYFKSGIMVAPIYGPGGTRLKILAAMAAKLPVVTTSTGNQGIDAKPNEEILLAESAEKLATQAIKLLKDESLYKKISLNARLFVLKNFSYPSIAQKLDRVYNEAVND